jgi:hypothetical protein
LEALRLALDQSLPVSRRVMIKETLTLLSKISMVLLPSLMQEKLLRSFSKNTISKLVAI